MDHLLGDVDPLRVFDLHCFQKVDGETAKWPLIIIKVSSFQAIQHACIGIRVVNLGADLVANEGYSV